MISHDPVMALRLQRGATHLHHLGSRAVAEFLAEIARRSGEVHCILEMLREYESRLNLDMMTVTGADRFVRRNLLAVPQ